MISGVIQIVFILYKISIFPNVQATFKSRYQVEYYTSQHDLQRLAKAEKEIATAIDDYIQTLERRLELTKSFKSDFDSSGISLPDTSLISDASMTVPPSSDLAFPVTAHPFRAFRLLRRFVKDLPSLEKEIRKDEERKFLKLSEKVKSQVNFPTQSDIKGATEGILRVHDTYNINIDDFSSGNFFGLYTNTSLNAADCFYMGVYALQSSILTRAIEWLEQAYRLVSSNDSSISGKEIQKKLEEAVSQHNKALMGGSKNPYLFVEKVSVKDVVNGRGVVRRRLLEKDDYLLRNKESSLMDLTNFAAICGGKELRSQEELKGLSCWYEKRQPVNLLNPLKVESHSLEPLVLQLHEVISDRLVGKIVTNAKETMSRSQVHAKSHPDSKEISASRTSTSTWLQDDQKSRLKSLNNVYQKLEAFTGLKVIGNGVAEDLQVSCYGIAGHFNPHLDTIFNAVDKSTFDKDEVAKGDRLATFMFYFSNVPRGGATAFPRIGVKVEPSKGSVLFWYNMDERGEPNPLTLHGGCPILYGNKCVGNKWIRYNRQSKKCPV